MYGSKLEAGAGVSGSSPLVGSPKNAVLQVKREVRQSGRASPYRNRTATRQQMAYLNPPTAFPACLPGGESRRPWPERRTNVLAGSHPRLASTVGFETASAEDPISRMPDF